MTALAERLSTTTKDFTAEVAKDAENGSDAGEWLKGRGELDSEAPSCYVASYFAE